MKPPLRRLAARDLHAFQAYRSDPEVGRLQGWVAQPDAEALAFLNEMSTAPLLAPGLWTQLGIADTATGELLGDIGLHLSADAREVEIGFSLARSAQGRGLGRRWPCRRPLSWSSRRPQPAACLRKLTRATRLACGCWHAWVRGRWPASPPSSAASPAWSCAACWPSADRGQAWRDR